MHSKTAYTVGMQYTLRNIPGYLDRLIREKAQEDGRSLNEVVLEALCRAFGLAGNLPRQRDLEDVAGTWEDDPEADEALAQQREVDEEMWR